MATAVIGAGPVGCKVAELLAKRGEKTTIYEEHQKPGEPEHCTGIVSERLVKMVRTQSVLNKISEARIVGEKTEFIVRGRAFVIDRRKFDQERAEKAQAAGAQLMLGEKVSVDALSQEHIVAADGSRSQVRSRFQDYTGLLPSAQYLVHADFNPDQCEIHLPPTYQGPGLFLWIVPINSGLAKIGVACQNPVKVLEEFLSKRFQRYTVEKKMAGTVVIGGPINPDYGRVKLVGDAAGQVKATTGGGLVTGLACAQFCAESILEGTDYRKACSKVYSQLWFSYFARKFWNKLSPTMREELLNAAADNISILESADMDWQRDTMARLALNNVPLLVRSLLDYFL